MDQRFVNNNLVFIDAQVEDYSSLIQGLVPGAEVFILHPQEDGIDQITEILEKRGPIKTLHLVTHGLPGRVFLGNAQLSSDSIEGYKTQLTKWAKALGSDGDLLIYGCNVAAEAGTPLLRKLRQLTGANIAASKSFTGNQAKGGNWDLEVQIGEITSPRAFSSQAMTAYAGVLDPGVTITQTAVDAGAPITIVAEGNLGDAGLDTYDIVLNEAPTANVTIEFSNADGRLEAIAPITFTPDNWDTPQTVEVRVVNDDVYTAFRSVIDHAISQDSDPEYLAAQDQGLLEITIDLEDPATNFSIPVTIDEDETPSEQNLINIAQTFIERYDEVLRLPGIFEEEFANPLLTQNVTFSYPQQQQIFVPLGGVRGDYVGQTAVEDSIFEGLANWFPFGSQILEFLPNLENNRVAIRLMESGTGTQTGLKYEQPATYVVQINPNQGLVERVEFYSNEYAKIASVLDSPLPPPPPENALTGQPVIVDNSVDPAMATEVATSLWQALIENNFEPTDPNSFLNLNAADVRWDFAVGGPDFLPYVGSAQGLANEDFTAGVLPELLLPLGDVVQPGNLEIVETFADGNRVLVHLREQGATAIETGNGYDLDLLSWVSVNPDGQVTSNEVIVNTYATVNAVRPGETSPLGARGGTTKRQPVYFATASQTNSTIVAFDRDGNFVGVNQDANNTDAPELARPIALTYGENGDLYVTSSQLTAGGIPVYITNAVLEFEGVAAEYHDVAETRDDARTNDAPRLQNVDPSLPDYNPALFGDAHGAILDDEGNVVTGNPFVDPGSLMILTDPVTQTGRPIDFATDDPATALPALLIPTGIKFGPDGNMYIASAFTSRILQYDGETGQFLSVFGSRPNGAGPTNTGVSPRNGQPLSLPFPNGLNPEAGLPPDFTVMVFGPDGGIYQASIRTNIDPVTGRPEINPQTGQEDFSYLDVAEETGPNGDGFGAVLRFPGPTWEIDPDTGFYIDPIDGKLVPPGQPAGLATSRSDLSQFGVYGETGGIISQGIHPLEETSAVAFGPDLNLYVTSAETAEVMAYTGPFDSEPGRYLGVFADIGTAVKNDAGRPNDHLALSGLGFGPDGNLYVASSFENEETGAPTGGSQMSIFVGPNPGAFGQTGTPGSFIDTFGDVSTDVTRIGLPTTPEFVFFENSYKQENKPTHRFPEIAYVVGVNTDPALSPEGIPGFLQSDNSDALAAYDRDFNFLGFLGTQLTKGELENNIVIEGNPLNGIGNSILTANGNLLVSSTLSNQVLEYNSLTGQYLGVFGDASSEGSGLQSPTSLALSGTNEILFVVDQGNGRILRFNSFDGTFGDNADTPENEGIAIELGAEDAGKRLTGLAFGPDGRLYVGVNPDVDAPTPGSAEVRVYNTETGALERSIGGLDYVVDFDFGPEKNLYISDNPAFLFDPATGEPIEPDKQSRVLAYQVDYIHPLVDDPQLITEFNVGINNAGNLTATSEEGTGNPLIFLTNPSTGAISVYQPDGTLIDAFMSPFPDAASPENGGADADNLPRASGSVFITEKDTFPVTIVPVDDAPMVLAPLPEINIDENTIQTEEVDLSEVFTDIDNDDSIISYSLSSNSNQELVNAIINGNILTLAYEENKSGTVELVIQASSNSLSTTDTLNIVINPVDQTFEGGPEDDFVIGGSGNDNFSGGEGNDKLITNDGNDMLIGGQGNDTLKGNDGADTLKGGSGRDNLEGGLGGDTYQLNASNANGSTIEDIGGEGDVLELESGRISRLELAEGIIGFTRQRNDLIIDINKDGKAGTGNDLSIVAFFERNRNAPGIGFIETVDNLTGQEILDALASKPVPQIRPGDNNDNDIEAGDGNDLLLGQEGNDIIVGRQGRDFIAGGQGKDSLNGGTERDTIQGYRGNDTITGGGGADVLEGGAGKDTYQINPSNASGTTIKDSGGNNDSLELQSGEITRDGLARNTIGFARDDKHLIIDINQDGKASRTEDLTLLNFFVKNKNEAGEGFIENMGNLTGNQILKILGAEPVPQVKIGGNFDNQINGEDGDDRLSGQAGNDSIEGRQGKDLITGGQGRDSLNGGQGNDTIKGNNGRDTLNGGGGRDVLEGGTGNDTYQVNATNANGTIIEDSDGNDDTLELNGGNISRQGLVEGSIGFVRHLNNLLIDINQNGEAEPNQDLMVVNFFANNKNKAGSGFIENVGNLTGNQILNTLDSEPVPQVKIGNQNDNTINGGGGKDRLLGGDGNDTIEGRGGDDLMTGGQGKDNLNGGQGNDNLKGNKGRDTIIGGPGFDVIQGGDGADVFVLDSATDTTDIIRDFEDGTDKLGLPDGLTFNQLTVAAGQGNFTLLLEAGEVLAQLNGISSDAITRADFTNDF